MNENEKKAFVNSLLIQINIKTLAFWVLYFVLGFIIYFTTDYLYGFKNSIFEILEINYLFYSFRSNFLNLKKKTHISNVSINIKGLSKDDIEILKERIFSKNLDYSREIVFKNINQKYENLDSQIFLKAKLNTTNLNNNSNSIQTPIEENIESYMKSENLLQVQEDQYSYSIFVSFKNCDRNISENTIHLYNSRISLFCLNNEINKSDFFIILNDLFDIWFLKIIENEPEMTKYSSIQILIYNLFDLGIDYTDFSNLNKTRSYLVFEKFISQISQLLHVNIRNQNKYITKESIDFQDNMKTYYRLIQNFNGKDYKNYDQETLTIPIFNHFSNLNNTNNYSFANSNNDFLFIHSNISKNENKLAFPITNWINLIRSLLLPKDYKLNFKSRINNVTFKNHITEENQNIFLSEWQISAIKLIYSNTLFNRIIFNIDKFFLTLNFYNKFKLPKHIIYTIKHINEVISNFHIVNNDYFPSILKNSNYLLFNSEFHNKKTYNTDLIMAVYSPIALPILFLIIISIFRIIKHSKMKFE